MSSDLQLTSSLGARSFLALLIGLSKQTFSGDTAITDDVLASEIFTGIEQDHSEILTEISCARRILQTCAAENLDVAKLTEILGSSSSVSPEIRKVFIAFWEREAASIHSKVLSSTRWNRHYKTLAWRVDLCTASMRDTEVNEPLGLFEFAAQSGIKSAIDPERKVARFQMNRKQLGEMLTTLEGIKKKIEQDSSNSNMSS